MSTSNSHQTISKETMLAGFLDAVPAIDDNISPMKLLRVFRHLIECAQSTITAYHEPNFLFLVVPPSVCPVYSNGPRLTNPVRPGTNPGYINDNAIQNQMIKDQWAVNKKYFEEDQNMNKSLTERFLQLVPAAQRQGYKDILVGDPNHRFETTFHISTTTTVKTMRLKLKTTKDKMKAEWRPRDSSFANKPISPCDALNMMMVAVTRTRLFVT